MKHLSSLLAVVLATLLFAACNRLTSQPTALSVADSTATTFLVTQAPSPSVTPSPAQTATGTSHCTPTFADELSPSYVPNAPVRSVVGHGHVLTGVVRSSVDCAPISDAKIELWPESPAGGHPDDYRATVFTDSSGAYRFECNPTGHIHMRISAPGYQTIASNAYHTDGKSQGIFDIVLEPGKS